MSTTRLAIALSIIIVLLGAAAALVLVQQHAPPITVNPNTILPQCSTLTESPSPAPSGTGTIQFTCGSGPAFTSPIGGSSTVSFKNNSTNLFCPSTSPCYSTIGYIQHGTICDASFLSLGNNTAITVASGSYDYCAPYVSPPVGGSLPSFDIFWSG